jgi:hypothetical protein
MLLLPRAAAPAEGCYFCRRLLLLSTAAAPMVAIPEKMIDILSYLSSDPETMYSVLGTNTAEVTESYQQKRMSNQESIE